MFTLIKVAGDQAAAAGVGRVGQVDHREADEDHPRERLLRGGENIIPTGGVL